MKELSIEDKAKAYDEVISKLKGFMAQGVDPLITRADVQDFFPELKESEDEKIRKVLIDYFKRYKEQEECGIKTFYGIPTDNILTWLEKQGEQKPVSKLKSKFRVGDEIKTSNEESLTITKIDEKGYWSEDLFICGFDGADKWELVEQKPANKVEPKFHEGEWIVWQNKCYKVNDNGCGYELIDQNGLSTSLEYGTIDESAHLWDATKDAKDGDVLCCESGWTCIFKTLNIDNISFSSYCFMSNTGWFCETGSESHTLEKAFIKAYNGEIYPATKEQRDTLEKAMTDAGYTFDFESKELKKLGQSEVTKMSDQEEIAEIPFGAKDSELQEVTYYIPEGFHAEIDDDKVVIKKGEKPTWSDEDEQITLSIEQVMNCASLLNIVPEKTDKIRTWLKSIKDKYTWKPSDEQLKQLGKYCIDNIALTSLYEYLKQL